MTFAVETYSGGLPRIVSIRTLPSLRSFLSFARLTRTSFALLSASIRWSRERSGAWAWVLVGLTAGRSYQCSRELQAGTFRTVSGLFARLLASSGLATPASAHAAASSARTRAGAPGSAKRTVPSAMSRAPQAANSSASRPDSIAAHPDDRQAGRLVADAHRVEGDRLQRRAREAAAAARERRAEVLVERRPAERVDEREAVRARGGDRASDLRDVGMRGGELRVERQSRRRAAGRDDLRRRVGGLVDVRAREVELDRLDAGQARARLRVVVGAEAADAHPERDRRARRRRGRCSARKRSRPGLARPIALSIPCAVSAIRGGALPSRGSGVTVLRHERVELPRDVRRRERVEAAARVEDPHATASTCARTRAASSTGPSRQSRLSAPSISTTQP